MALRKITQAELDSLKMPSGVTGVPDLQDLEALKAVAWGTDYDVDARRQAIEDARNRIAAALLAQQVAAAAPAAPAGGGGGIRDFKDTQGVGGATGGDRAAADLASKGGFDWGGKTSFDSGKPSPLADPDNVGRNTPGWSAPNQPEDTGKEGRGRVSEPAEPDEGDVLSDADKAAMTDAVTQSMDFANMVAATMTPAPSPDEGPPGEGKQADVDQAAAANAAGNVSPSSAFSGFNSFGGGILGPGREGSTLTDPSMGGYSAGNLLGTGGYSPSPATGGAIFGPGFTQGEPDAQGFVSSQAAMTPDTAAAFAAGFDAGAASQSGEGEGAGAGQGGTTAGDPGAEGGVG